MIRRTAGRCVVIDGLPADSWSPVLQFDRTTWLGLLDGELWFGTSEEPRRLMKLGNPVWLLPMYEHPRDRVLADLATREKELSLPEGYLVASIPWDDVEKSVMTMGSTYWAELLLDWCEGQPLTPTEMGVFTQLSQSSWASQRVRHRAGIRVHRQLFPK